MNKFRLIFLCVAFSTLIHAKAQVIPNYTILATETVSLNKLCQNQSGTQSNGTASYKKVISDSSGNLYFVGQIDANPALSPVISLAVNKSSAHTTPASDFTHFITKYNTNADLEWVTTLSDMPKKIFYDKQEETIILLYQRNIMSGGGLWINGSFFQLDSNYGENDLVIFTLNPSNGSFNNQYINRFTQDLIFYGSKKLLVFKRQYTSTYYVAQYGFFENNQVKKWQTLLNGHSALPVNLIYNPVEKVFWAIDGIKYKKLRTHETQDSLIAENIEHEIFHEFSRLYFYLMKPSTYCFTADGGYIAEIQGTIDKNNYPSKMVKIDSSGNLVWQIIVPDGLYPYQLDKNGDIWFDVNEIFYSTKVQFLPSNVTYLVNPFGNMPLYGNYIWHLDGKTGEFKNGYFNGYGTVGQLKDYQFMITSTNELITMPEHGSIVYFPNNSGEFIPYTTSCNNDYKSGQFLWVKYNLNNLKSFKTNPNSIPKLFENDSELIVFPNPANKFFSIKIESPANIGIYDMKGRCLEQFSLDKGESVFSIESLDKGVYILRNLNNGQATKLIIE